MLAKDLISPFFRRSMSLVLGISFLQPSGLFLRGAEELHKEGSKPSHNRSE